MIDAVALLKGKKLTVTPQRIEIVSLLSKYGHLSVDDLYKHLSVNFPSISLATVYKNINTMLEKDFVLELKIKEKKNLYELMKEEHSHVACTRCGEVLDIELDMCNLVEDIEQKTHYNLEGSSATFLGLCPKCRDN